MSNSPSASVRTAVSTRSDVQKKRRFAEGLCQQCGSPDISPRSATGVRCTPCLDRSSELKKARAARIGPGAWVSARERAWRAAGVCWNCGDAVAPTSKNQCPRHLEIHRKANHTRRAKWTAIDRTRHIWADVLQRCNNPRAGNYPNYGARGVTVCERWKKFANFLADMGERPSPEHSIDRIDVNGNYEPTNCRWTTLDVQMSNRTDNHKLTIGDETLTIAQWSRKTGVRQGTIHGRLKRGLAPELAVSKVGTR